MNKMLGKSLSVILVTAIILIGSIGGTVSAADISGKALNEPVATVTVDDQSFLLPLDGSDKVLGSNKGPITVEVVSPANKPFAMEIEALADGTLVARVSKTAGNNTSFDYMKTETIYAKSAEDTQEICNTVR
ncbi:MAG: hypothetical protein WC958_03985 [Dehalococcoidales bacterium]